MGHNRRVTETMRLLAEAVERRLEAQAGSGSFATAVDGLVLIRARRERLPTHFIQAPSLCLVVRGAKWTTFGDRRFDYRAGEALVVSLAMPGFSQVGEGAGDDSYLSIVVELDAAIMGEVLRELPSPPAAAGADRHGASVAQVSAPIADGLLRAVRLLDSPRAIPALYPGIMREFCYWLLTGPSGGDVARITLGDGPAHRVIDAVHTLLGRFREPVRVEELARAAGLSPSAFHRRFKALTSMTPLQYQKRLRLLEARRLLVSEGAGAEEAAYRVGYESASQFSREYARTFGTPPRRSVAALRHEARHEAAAA